MTAMPQLRSILNDTPANAIDVDWNFQTLEDYVATDVVKSDGSVAMAAPLNLTGPPPTLASHAVPKSYVDAAIPIGVVWMFGGDATKQPPAGWVYCDGTPRSATAPEYVALFAVIGYSFGGSSGTFNLPNMCARMPVGRVAGDPNFDKVGMYGGARDSTLAAHSHTIAHGHTGRLDVYTGDENTDHTHDHNHGHSASAGIQDAGHVHGAVGTAGYFAHTQQLAGPQHAGGQVGVQGNGFQDLSAITTGAISANHSHPITVNGTGVIQTGGTTGGYGHGAIHHHAINADLAINAIDTNSRSGTEGAAPTNTNYPPYMTLNFIIRIG